MDNHLYHRLIELLRFLLKIFFYATIAVAVIYFFIFISMRIQITAGQIVSLILFLAGFTTLLLNLRRISKWLGNRFKNFAQKDKKRITELEKSHSEEMTEIKEKHIKDIEEFKKTISGLEAKTCDLERQTQIMDKVPGGCWLIQNNVLHEKETGIDYCWNCWNKINGRERRVLEGNKYYVSCKICGIHTKLKDYPRQEPHSYY